MIGAYGSHHSKDSSEYRLQKHMSGESMIPVANIMSEKRSKGRVSLNPNDDTDMQRRSLSQNKSSDKQLLT